MKTRIQNRKIKHRISRKKYGKRKGGDPIDEDAPISSTVRNKPIPPIQGNRNRALSKVFSSVTSAISPQATLTARIKPSPIGTRTRTNRTRALGNILSTMPSLPSWPKRDAKIEAKENDLDVSSTISDTDLSGSSLGSSEGSLAGKIIFNPLYKSSGEKGGKRKKYKRTKTTKIKK